MMIYGFDWEASLQEVLYMGSLWGNRNEGSLKLSMTKEEVKTDYWHFVKAQAWEATQGNDHFSKFKENRSKHFFMQCLIKLWNSLPQEGKKKKKCRKKQEIQKQIKQANNHMTVQVQCQV